MVAAILSLAMSVSDPPKILIGNYLVTAPNGIAWIEPGPEASIGAVLDFGGEYAAGLAAPDDSYHAQTISVNGASVSIEWGTDPGELPGAVGRLISDRAVVLKPRVLETTWPSYLAPSYEHAGRAGVATEAFGIGARDMEVQLGLRWSVPQVTDAIEVPLQPGTPVYFRWPCQPSLEMLNAADSRHIAERLDRARAAYLARRPTAAGDWGDFVGAIADNLNNSRIYASDQPEIFHSVSRGWAGGKPNNSPLFCWDSFFNGALACLDDPVTARSTVRAILGWQTKEGLVPNFGHLQFDKSRSSDDRSQPPVGSLCVWKMHQRWPDAAFLKEVYPKLLKWHRWWPTARDGDHDGLLEWGSNGVGKQGALWETGWDDTPEYAESEMVGTTLDTDAVDLNALYAMDAENLALIADAVGDRATAKQLRNERFETIKLMNERLWNPELGIYCSRKWQSRGGKFLTRLTPMNFYPLIAGAASPEQAKRVLSVMTDPKRFWGKWILPTVAYGDPVWPQQGYWHGTVWAPVNFLVFQGLRRYAPPELVAEFARKSVDLFMRNWRARGWCGENFGSDNGVVHGDQHYTWGALMCLLGLESICAIEPDGAVTLNGAQTAELRIDNVPIHGHRYSVETGTGYARLIDHGSLVFEARSRRLTRRI